jgi:hypothetical protein
MKILFCAVYSEKSTTIGELDVVNRSYILIYYVCRDCEQCSIYSMLLLNAISSVTPNALCVVWSAWRNERNSALVTLGDYLSIQYQSSHLFDARMYNVGLQSNNGSVMVTIISTVRNSFDKRVDLVV